MYSLSLSIIIRNMIQETLEEAAKRIFPNKDSFGATARNGFVQGAKWKEEISISKEAYEDSLNMQRCSNAGYQSKINELKSEIGRMYNEEEFEEKTLLSMISIMQEYSIINESSVVQFHKEWFEQFKKK